MLIVISYSLIHVTVCNSFCSECRMVLPVSLPSRFCHARGWLDSLSGTFEIIKWNIISFMLYKLNTRSSHRIEKKCNCNVKNLILCSCRHCNLWNYFGGVSLGNPRKLILVLLSYFLQQSSRLSFNNLQSTVYHSVYHVYGSHYCWLFCVFFFKLHDPLKFF